MPELDTPTVQLQLQEENARLRRAVEELSIINDLARDINASLEPNEIIQSVIRRSLRAVHAEQGVVTMLEAQSEDPMRTLVRAMRSSSQREQYHLHQVLVGWMHLNKKPLLINAPGSDERFRGVRWDASIRSLLCVPMMVKSELRGVLTVYNKKDDSQFTGDDQRLLAILAAQSVQIIENARLHEREKLFLKMQEELKLAAKIQSDLLPQAPPSIPGYDLAATNIPAQEVGGDHYDFIPMDDHRLAICLGDVSGKGLPASLLMANLQATLRSQALTTSAPGECVRHANTLLYQTTSAEKFVTLFYCVLDYGNHALTFTNAGHEFPTLIGCDGAVRRLETGGLAIGILGEFPYGEDSVTLTRGDLLVICSDGISEAMNLNEEQFGDDRLSAVIAKHRERPAREVIVEILKAVKAHAGTAAQADDMTLVVLRRVE